jgi:hypothetical protein
MDKVNMERIKARLIGLGFDQMVEEKLMAQVCFGAAAFDLRFDKEVGEDSCTFLVRVQRIDEQYSIVYYNAYFRKGFALPESTLKLAARMPNINWNQMAHSLSSVGFYVDLPVLQDAFTLLREIKKVPESSLILYKYWAGTTLESLVPDVVTLKNKYELTQRFYVSEEHQPITGDEAIRFLQHRWLEKAMQQSRLQQRQETSGNNENTFKKSKRKPARKK